MKNNEVLDEQMGKAEAAEPKEVNSPSRRTRRKFLGEVGGIAAAGMAAGVIGLEPLLGSKRAVVEAAEITPTSDSVRADTSKSIRKTAADNEKALGLFPHPTNGDEELYP